MVLAAEASLRITLLVFSFVTSIRRRRRKKGTGSEGIGSFFSTKPNGIIKKGTRGAQSQDKKMLVLGGM
jgi:hypothetical protein